MSRKLTVKPKDELLQQEIMDIAVNGANDNEWIMLEYVLDERKGSRWKWTRA